MNEKDFLDLLVEIDSMSIEEYNKFHEKAIRMKESRIYVENETSNEDEQNRIIRIDVNAENLE